MAQREEERGTRRRPPGTAVLTWDFETPDGQVNRTELEANPQPRFD